MSGLFGRGVNTERCQPPGDLGINGGASAFNGLALAVARYERRTQVVMKANVSGPPTPAHDAAWICRKAGAPPISRIPPTLPAPR